MASSDHHLARLVIPTSPPSAADYRSRLAALLGSEGTHIYIDTSFLMWSTKIGPAARGQLLGWLRDELGARAHIPTWAAHEYLRHHVKGTIIDELSRRSDEVSQLAGSTFNYFRPFLDDPALPQAEGWDHLRASTRTAVNSLTKLSAAARVWKQTYHSHAEQVIEYINEHALPVRDLFDVLTDITTSGAARYEGRIPPGFQDRNKKGENDDDPDEAGAGGANRYGDLVFWKEALTDARHQSASAIVILTNDRKNDWRLGGQNASPDAHMVSYKRSWRPVPTIHPMLALEAQMAGVGEVVLVDSEYLATLLIELQGDRLAAFTDVAIVPDPPPEPSEDERRAKAVAERLALDGEERAAEQERADAEAAEQGFRFADDPTVKSTRIALQKALLKSRGELSQRAERFLTRLRTGGPDAISLSELATAENFAGFDHDELVAIARTLHDRSIDGRSGFIDPMIDLLGLLDELPPATATSLFLGILGSMYLASGTGDSRIPPKSAATVEILAALERPYADMAINVVAERLNNNARSPLFVPGAGDLEARFEIEAETMEVDELRSLRIGGVEVLTAGQDDVTLQLRSLFGDARATEGAILARAAVLYVIPPSHLVFESNDVTEFYLTETIGFRSPDHVFRNRDAQ